MSVLGDPIRMKAFSYFSVKMSLLSSTSYMQNIWSQKLVKEVCKNNFPVTIVIYREEM